MYLFLTYASFFYYYFLRPLSLRLFNARNGSGNRGGEKEGSAKHNLCVILFWFPGFTRDHILVLSGLRGGTDGVKDRVLLRWKWSGFPLSVLFFFRLLVMPKLGVGIVWSFCLFFFLFVTSTREGLIRTGLDTDGTWGIFWSTATCLSWLRPGFMLGLVLLF